MNASGLLLIDKSAGPSSAEVLEDIKGELRRRYGLRTRDLPKIGHGGTLDPFASGLLVVMIGEAVKLSRYFLGSVKTYEARLKWGERTSSGDLTNEVIEISDFTPTYESLQKEAYAWMGREYLQTPPMHSAKKIDGVALYVLARQGQEVTREPKACQVLEFNIAPKTLENRCDFTVSVSSGTFIRTLAEDFAAKLGTLAHLEKLRRIASGSLSLEKAVTFETWKNQLPERIENFPAASGWVPFNQALDGLLPGIDVDASDALAIQQGQRARIQLIMFNNRLKNSGPWAVKNQGKLIAVISKPTATHDFEIDRVFISDRREPEL